MYPAIPVTRTQKPAAKPASDTSLGFGQIFTDHMFIMDYVEGQGWIDARIVPYAAVAGSVGHGFPLWPGHFRRAEGVSSAGRPGRPVPSASEF